MPTDPPPSPTTLALNTKVEEDFVSPLTAIRGSLEILRDVPDLTEAKRQQFVATALRGCARLETSVEQLAATVYASDPAVVQGSTASLPEDEHRIYANRVHFLSQIDTVELDFSDFEFSSSDIVNNFYDVIDAQFKESGRRWHVMANHSNCRVWPEAWIAFAHRGKKVKVTYALGNVRFAVPTPSAKEGDNDGQKFDPDHFTSREEALSKIEEMRRS